MLPTKGYFQDIECPYFENSCGRPYCHFRHRKKQLDLVDESSNEETPGEVPTYKPTPKSELAVSRSHIPISYVPDIIYRAEKPIRNSTVPKTTFLAKPTYKPTPISLLTSAVKNDEESDSINELKQSMADRKYSPKAENVPLFEYKPTALEDKIIDENLKKHEYKPTGENSNNIEYNPTALEDISEHNSSDVVYKPTSNNIPSIDYKPSAYLLDNSNINFENLDTEFDMIDEIINMSDKTKQLDKEVGENLIESVENNDIKIQRDKDSKSSSKKMIKFPKNIRNKSR
ncbi:hypothetical protein HHI36_020051 [Cryptolaemus montrouzieri]|uniref:C3H1-type domain-containing protein n=1 Tax=Cryptolaemus montrouzieri TaxID=559131 RepID=A0ABD2N9C3_9CUCU